MRSENCPEKIYIWENWLKEETEAGGEHNKSVIALVAFMTVIDKLKIINYNFIVRRKKCTEKKEKKHISKLLKRRNGCISISISGRIDGKIMNWVVINNDSLFQ